jgi:hypothetical protein
MAADSRFTAKPRGKRAMPEDFHMISINRLDEGVRKLGERTGEAEKKMAVHENECANRYKQIAETMARMEAEMIRSSKKQILLTQMFGYGIGGLIAAFQAVKAIGWF